MVYLLKLMQHLQLTRVAQKENYKSRKRKIQSQRAQRDQIWTEIQRVDSNTIVYSFSAFIYNIIIQYVQPAHHSPSLHSSCHAKHCSPPNSDLNAKGNLFISKRSWTCGSHFVTNFKALHHKSPLLSLLRRTLMRHEKANSLPLLNGVGCTLQNFCSFLNLLFAVRLSVITTSSA